jgi:glycosyltransferase involved in cell wall biosynthesis
MRDYQITVVIPTYNHGRYVVEAVESALRQTVRTQQIIVVDDGSTDDTQERLKPYLDRIEYVRKTNAGLSAARNTGIERACGEWVAFLDADDVWGPHKSELQLHAATEHPEAALIGAADSRTWPLPPLPPKVGSRIVSIEELVFRTVFAPSSALIRREVFSEVGVFDEQLSPVADRDMWFRIAMKHSVICVDAPCWYYRPTPGQMSRDARLMLDSFLLFLEKTFKGTGPYSHFRKAAYSYIYYDAAWTSFENYKRLDALWYLGRSLVYHPTRIPNERPLARLKTFARFMRPYHNATAGTA